MSKKILITGVTGQDGSYMAEYLLERGYQVYGMVRRTAQIHDNNFRHLLANPDFQVVRGDLSDSWSIDTLVQSIKPDYFINFAAQSFVGDSWRIPEETLIAGGVAVLRCLEAIKKHAPACRFYNAGSSEQFGDVVYTPQDEKHPFRPRSVYAAAKCAGSHIVKVYRESYQLYAVQGLLFNHESERRGEEFVTRKITKGVARIVKNLRSGETIVPIELGNVQARRDWSHARDFVDGVWRMLNQELYNDILFNKLKGNPTYISRKPRQGSERHLQELLDSKALSKEIQEYVLASGETHSIAEFVESAFRHANVTGHWEGYDLNEEFVLTHAELEKGCRWSCNREKVVGVKINPKFYRPNEVNSLQGDSTQARKDLLWKPQISFDNLVKLMVEHDLYEAGIISQETASTQQSSENNPAFRNDCVLGWTGFLAERNADSGAVDNEIRA